MVIWRIVEEGVFEKDVISEKGVFEKDVIKRTENFLKKIWYAMLGFDPSLYVGVGNWAS